MVVIMSPPYLEGSVRSPLTLLKMGLGSPQGLPKTQNTITGVKTPRIEVVLHTRFQASWPSK